MSGTSLKSLILGFIAGAIATVTIHEAISYLLLQAGIYSSTPWSLEPTAGFGIPQIASDALWGGLWGVVFALILGNIPKGSMTLKGLILGILGPALVGVLILVPILTAKIPLFYNGEPNAVGSVLLIGAGFGAVTAWLYGFLTSGCRLP
jgi:hypothetical protein